MRLEVLENKCHKRMQAMQQLMNYILGHITKNVTVEELAEHFNYNPRYLRKIFVEYFEMPAHTFIKKLQMRNAARSLINGISIRNKWDEYGFESNISFSNGFKKEFGISPRDFMKNELTVPDMPDRQALFGTPIMTRREKVRENTQKGFPLKKARQLGWGKLSMEKSDVPEDLYEDIPADHYAVFAFAKKEDPAETAMMTNLLLNYIACEWSVLNRKVVNAMENAFQRDDGRKIYLYVPYCEEAKMYGKVTGGNNVRSWIEYIDDHISEDMTEAEIAAYFGYSEKNFIDLFLLYHGMNPAEYALRRKLYLAAMDLYDGQRNITEIVTQYGFKSSKDLKKQFEAEYKLTIDQIISVTDDAIINPLKIESRDVDKISYDVQYLREFNFLYRRIALEYPAGEEEDVPRQASYFFTHDFPCLEGTLYSDSNEKIAFWEEYKNEETGQKSFGYALGPVVGNGKSVPKGMALKEFEEGRYAIFESGNETDTDNMSEVFRMMTRIVFYQWIHENMYRFDGRRLTYVKYQDEKLYFYVPVHY